MCFGEVGGLDYLLTFMTYCAHLIFCIDDMESVFEAKKCSVFAIHSKYVGRETGSAKQAAHIIYNNPKVSRA